MVLQRAKTDLDWTGAVNEFLICWPERSAPGAAQKADAFYGDRNKRYCRYVDWNCPWYCAGVERSGLLVISCDAGRCGCLRHNNAVACLQVAARLACAAGRRAVQGAPLL